MRTFIVCAASALLSACALFDGKGTALEITTEISPTTFRAGDQVLVTITTKNNGSRPQGISTESCGYPFAVFDSQGHKVGPQSLTCSLSARVIFLKPGDSYVQRIPWSGDGFVDGADRPLRFPPGTYSIRSYWSDDAAEIHSSAFQVVN